MSLSFELGRPGFKFCLLLPYFVILEESVTVYHATISPPIKWILHNAMLCSIVMRTVVNTDCISNCHLWSTDYPSASAHANIGTYSPYGSSPRMSFFLAYVLQAEH